VAGRLVRIVGGYLAASLAAGTVIASGLLLMMLLDTTVRGPASDLVRLAPVYWVLLSLIAARLVIAFAFIPAAVVIAVAEVARLRSAAFYAAIGAAVAVACWTCFVRPGGLVDAPGLSLSQPSDRVFFAGTLVLLAGAAGLTGGLAYWRIAGRTAGAWRIVQRAQP
jgi:hypothetical protein